MVLITHVEEIVEKMHKEKNYAFVIEDLLKKIELAEERQNLLTKMTNSLVHDVTDLNQEIFKLEVENQALLKKIQESKKDD